MRKGWKIAKWVKKGKKSIKNKENIKGDCKRMVRGSKKTERRDKRKRRRCTNMGGGEK